MSIRFLRSAFWIGIYFLMAIAPILAMHIGPTPPGRGFWREFSVGIGFAGLSMMGLQFFLTGRFRDITAPYGIDVVYHFHRNISLIAFSFIFLHVVVLFVTSPEIFILMNPISITWWMAGGVVALFSFAIVILSSLYRKRLGLSYERWRIIHGYISVVAMALSVAHIIGVNYYVEGFLKRGLWLVMITAWVLALAHVRVIKSLQMLNYPYMIEKVLKERGNSWTLVLRADGHKGMAFKPGQFAWLTVGKSPFAIREHPFSFSSSAMESDPVRMTIKELGDFTSQIGEIVPGTRAYLDGPYGSFTTDGNMAPGYCFIAGGVGITPVMSILRTMKDRHDTRPLLLFYGSRTWDETTFREELEELKTHLDLRVVHVLEAPPTDWNGESGRISAAIMARHLPDNRMDLEYFICGPYPMQKAVKVTLDRLGLPMENVQSESFNFV